MRWPGSKVWFACGSRIRYSQHLAGLDRLRRREILAIAPAEDVGGNHLLVAAQLRVSGNSAGHTSMIFTTQSASLPVVDAKSRAQRFACDAHRLRQRLGLIDENVRPRGGLALVIHQPLAPGGFGRARVQRRAIPVRHGLGGIGDVLVEGLLASAGRSKPSCPFDEQVKILRLRAATARAGARPVVVALP